MEEQQLIEKVRDILAEEFEVDRDLMTEDAPLMSTLDLDSLDIVDLAVVVENNFGFKMKKEDFAEIKTFADLFDVIRQKSVR